MPTKKRHTPKRGADQATLTISLPKEMKERIEKAARSDNRTTSNFVVTELMKLLGKSGVLILAGLLAYHFARFGAAPKAWTGAKLAGTAKAAWAQLQHLTK